MKKILTVLTMCLMFLPLGFVCAAPDVEVQSTYGSITAISGNMVTVEGSGYLPKVTLTAVDEGYILNGQTGAKLETSALSVGMPISAYYTLSITKSNPPQTKSLAIITGNSPETAKYFQVGSAEHFANKTRVFNVNQTQYVTINDDIFPYPSYLTRGMELLLWYPVNTISTPRQATAVNAKNLYHDRIDIDINLQTGIAKVNGKEIPLTDDARSTPGILYLPVRSISNALDFNADWNSTEQKLIIKNAVFPVIMTVGSTTYQRDGENFELMYPPKISREGIMLVPVSFFTCVLDYTVDVNNNHI